jgi:hypothetical protein
MGQIQSELNEKNQRGRFKGDDNSADEFDNELYNDGYRGWVWRAYPDIARAYLTGDMEKFKELIAPSNKNMFGDETENYDTSKIDDIILYALGITNEAEDVYRFGEEDEFDPFMTISVMTSEDLKKEAERKVDHSDSDGESDEEAELPRPVLTNKTNVEVAGEIIDAILAHAGDNPPCFNPDNILTLAVERQPTLVSKVLMLNMALHPASVLPKVDWKGHDLDEQYAAIKQLLLADPRINNVNIHAVTWAVYQGDTDKLDALLNDPSLVVSEKDLLPLYWGVKNEQFEACRRLLADPRFNNHESITHALSKYEFFSNDRSIPMVGPLLEICNFNQDVFSGILHNAVRGKALGLMKTLLENPKYEHLVSGVDQKTINGLFMWGVSSTIHHKRCAETCNLLNKHFVLKNKSKYIASHCPGQTHYVDPYLKYVILNEAEMVDLIQYFSDRDRLTKLHSRGDSPMSTRIAWDIDDKIKECGYAIGSFDNAILKLFDLVPRPPEAESWEYIIDIFNVANKISSIETMVLLAERLKAETTSDHYQNILVYTIGDKYRQHLNPDIQQQKIDAFIRLLDLPNYPEGLNVGRYYSRKNDLIDIIKLMTPEAFDQLLADSDAKGNKLLSNDLHEIKGDLSTDQLLRDSEVLLLSFQAKMEKWKRELAEEKALIAMDEKVDSDAEEDIENEVESEEEEIVTKSRSRSPSKVSITPG